MVPSVLLDDIFFQIPEILGHHEAFLSDLRARLDAWDSKQTIGNWFIDCVSYMTSR